MLELFLAVCGKDLARFLEALVGELLEGNVRGALEGGTAAARADGGTPGGCKEVLFLASGYEVGVQISRRRRRRRRRW